MPIGVPRIIYCWGEELPAQWTDIYNFIFRRRMVFLMQYLDDELCNQICGLLINIHMEDRSKELEKKEMEKSGLFKSTRKESAEQQKADKKDPFNATGTYGGRTNISTEKKLTGPSFEDLLAADEDLGIEENNTLEQFTLQKITMEWLNWNTQFFDYSDEPYLFYLADMLSKDFDTNDAQMLYRKSNFGSSNEISILMNMFKNLSYGSNQKTWNLLRFESGKFDLKNKESESVFENLTDVDTVGANFSKNSIQISPQVATSQISTLKNTKSEINYLAKKKNHLDVYSPFRLLANFAGSLPNEITQSSKDIHSYNFKDINPNLLIQNKNSLFLNNNKIKLLELFNTTLRNTSNGPVSKEKSNLINQTTMPKLLTSLAQKNFALIPPPFATGTFGEGGVQRGGKNSTSENLLKSSEKGLSQRILRKKYVQDKNEFSSSITNSKTLFQSKVSTDTIHSGPLKPLNYLDFYSYKDSYNEFKSGQRSSGSRQVDKTLQEEEAKKIFVIINSFGGSVGNGITVHDALQFIKAGSLTLGLGVAASAASLALAGGTIGERYVTEGCHVMIHQPEGGIQGQASDIWIDSQEIMKIRLDVAEIYSLATYRPRHKILRDLDRDFYLTATETIHYGLADEIATNEVMHEIIEMTSKVWDYHDSKQQRLLESRESSNSGLDTQAQN